MKSFVLCCAILVGCAMAMPCGAQESGASPSVNYVLTQSSSQGSGPPRFPWTEREKREQENLARNARAVWAGCIVLIAIVGAISRSWAARGRVKRNPHFRSESENKFTSFDIERRQ